MAATLHYVFDPLCGWCYGAAPLARAASRVPGLAIELHGGGLWPEPTILPEATRRYIEQADARLAQISGQPLGDKYRTELLFDRDLVLDSQPTTRAVLAAQQLQDQGLEMLEAIQHAHYVEGRHVVRETVLSELAAEIGLDPDAFASACMLADPAAHIAATRELMRRIGAQGFPTFVLESGGRWRGIEHNRFHRDPDGFARALLAAIAQPASSTATGT